MTGLLICGGIGRVGRHLVNPPLKFKPRDAFGSTFSKPREFRQERFRLRMGSR